MEKQKEINDASRLMEIQIDNLLAQIQKRRCPWL